VLTEVLRVLVPVDMHGGQQYVPLLEIEVV
jgi:hypothetical protein